MGASGYHTGEGYYRVETAEVEEGLLKFSVTARRAIKAYLKEVGVPMLEGYAKSNAPWKDRTGTEDLPLLFMKKVKPTTIDCNKIILVELRFITQPIMIEIRDMVCGLNRVLHTQVLIPFLNQPQELQVQKLLMA